MQDRFDKAAIGTVVGLLLAIGVVIAHGDQLGIRVVRYGPTGTASSGAQIQVAFEELVDPTSVNPHFTIAPPVPGQWISTPQSLAFIPSQPFQPGKDYTVTLRSGITANTGRMLKQDVHWQFHVRSPRIVYLGPGDQAGENLYELDPSIPDQPVQLAQDPLGITSYDVMPDGSKIVYAQQPDGTTTSLSIWDATTHQSSLLYKCENARCVDPVWRPDGSMVAFAKINLTGTVFQPPRIWLFDTATNTAQPLFKDSQQLGQKPRWSPDGKHLIISAVDSNSLLIHDLASGKDHRVPALRDDVAKFSPDGKWLMLRKTVAPSPGTRATHLVLIDISAEPLTSRDIVPNNDPANDEEGEWFPDSKKLVVVRRAAYSANTAQASQIYTLDIATGTAMPLIADPGFRYSDLKLSPAGDMLIFQRFSVDKPGEPPQRFVADLSTGKLKSIANDTTDPAWRP